MESITFVPTYSSLKRAGRGTKLNDHEFSLIKNSSLILEVILRNTLRYNKLTSADEIYEELAYVQNDKATESETGPHYDIRSIENICEFLCRKNGILIRLEKNFKNYYRLNCNEKI